MLAMYEPVVDNPSAHAQQGEQKKLTIYAPIESGSPPSSSSPQAVRHFTVYRSMYTTFYVHVAQINLPEAIAAELLPKPPSLWTSRLQPRGSSRFVEWSTGVEKNK